MILTIVPVGKVPGKILKEITDKIKRNSSLPFSEIKIKSQVKTPSEAYNSDRNQFEADKMLEYVASKTTTPEKGRILAITQEDLYAGRLNFVFGQAQCPGKIAIISLSRLKTEFYGQNEDQDVLLSRATKEAVHEIGHTFGLGHCTDSKCVMSFSNSIVDVDRKNKGLCKDCRDKLEH